MKVVVTGGGSGGHITPLLAVATELKKAHAPIEIIYIGQKGDHFSDVVRKHPAIDSVRLIRAGKFRRYHGEGIRQLFDFKTLLFNTRDAILVLIGILQSMWHMGRIRPDILFIKGGFVGVPVGLAAALWRVPFVTHDSDALAGLANRIVARWATYHAVALPAEQYAYPREKTFTVGVPIAEQYQFVDETAKHTYKKQLAIPDEAQVLLVTGGGLGARLINESVVAIAPALMAARPTLRIVHTTGHKHFKSVSDAYAQVLTRAQLEQVQVIDYTSELHNYSGAADVVLARAGATNMAELAAQGKATIIVPNPVLAGGHQLKNAAAYESSSAAVVVQEAELRQNPKVLEEAVEQILSDTASQKRLSQALHAFAHPNSAQELAELLLSAKGKRR